MYITYIGAKHMTGEQSCRLSYYVVAVDSHFNTIWKIWHCSPTWLWTFRRYESCYHNMIAGGTVSALYCLHAYVATFWSMKQITEVKMCTVMEYTHFSKKFDKNLHSFVIFIFIYFRYKFIFISFVLFILCCCGRN